MTSLIARFRSRRDEQRAPGSGDWSYDQKAWREPFELLRKKWVEVPAGADRLRTDDLLRLSDAELRTRWEACRAGAAHGEMYSVRGWYYTLYRDVLRGKRVVDVGSGLGFDAITFARAGARIICADIVESNLCLIQRIAKLEGLDAMEFLYLEDLSSYASLPEVDIVWCQGSMISAPFAIAKEEATCLLDRLPVDGRWIELAYPRERWLRDGRLHPTRWGERTDGGAPWIEWYDLEKLQRRLAAGKFEPVLALNFHDDDFNWFDLLRVA